MQALILFKQCSNDGQEAKAKGVLYVLNDPISYVVISYEHLLSGFNCLSIGYYDCL
jgi:hypothetical protein